MPLQVLVFPCSKINSAPIYFQIATHFTSTLQSKPILINQLPFLDVYLLEKIVLLDPNLHFIEQNFSIQNFGVWFKTDFAALLIKRKRQGI